MALHLITGQSGAGMLYFAIGRPDGAHRARQRSAVPALPADQQRASSAASHPAPSRGLTASSHQPSPAHQDGIPGVLV